MKNRFYRIICAALAALFFYGCPMEEPPDGGENEGLDPRLTGIWRFSFDGSYEQCVITTQPRNDTNALGERNLGTLVFGAKGWLDSSTYHDSFGGDIVYAKSFRASLDDDKSAGIIIIEYWPGLENKWPHWSEAPYYWEEDGYRYPDRNYYGIYYINLFADGHQVFLACTNDQSTNYG
ncbi:MAG: hypothetical protein LBG72_05725, partial [Spirochaetaceae bacterium]|nr:hypothetical protein [Spirochaetaceae bacterium]